MRRLGIAAAALTGVALARVALTGALAATADQQPLTQSHDTFESAAETPAEDLNIKQTPIPEVLQRASANPYDLRSMDQCNSIAAEVVRLDFALGPDKDAPPPPDNRTVNQKRGQTAASALKQGVEWITPYRGVIRFATGATAYQKKVQLAIEAGFARRGFLKGMAMKMNCPPPASPAWYRQVVVKASQPLPAKRR